MKSRVSPIAALKYRDYRLYWIGLLISRIGSEMQNVAIAWHIYSLTRSPFSLGIIGFARFLPVITFALLGGTLADILNRKKMMFVSQIGMMMLSGILAYLTFVNKINPLSMYILIGASSAFSVLDTPARQSIIPYLVPKKYFMNAVGLSTILWQTALVLGPSLAGFGIAYLGLGIIYLINTVSFLGVILSLIFIRIPEKTGSRIRLNMDSLLHGFKFVFKTPIIYSTMLLDFFATFFSSATVLLPIFAKDILAVGPKGLGFLYAAPSLGAVIAGFIVSSLGHFKNQGRILMAAILLYGISTICFGFSKSFYLSVFFLFLTGIGDVVSTIIRNTIRQLKTPDHLRGRMISVNMIFFMGGPQLGEWEAGFLAGFAGAPISVIAGGAGTIAAVLLIYKLIPDLNKYQGNDVTL